MYPLVPNPVRIRHDFLRQIETATPEVEAGYDELIRAASKRETAMATNRIEKYGEMIKTTSSRTKVHLDNMPSRVRLTWIQALCPGFAQPHPTPHPAD